MTAIDTLPPLWEVELRLVELFCDNLGEPSGGASPATRMDEFPVFDSLDPHETCDLASVYQSLLARGELAAYESPSRFYEIGSPEGLEETRRHLK